MISVSIIVPCYNEEATIYMLLESIYQQTFPHAQMEVVIADGMSSDRTRQEIVRFQQDYPDLRVRLVDNPQRIIPAALNRAIQAAQGEYLVRLDAHCKPFPDYVKRCLEDLAAERGDNVGGVWDIRPWTKPGASASWVARGIATAAAHPLGAGDAQYRYTTKPQVVDTVPFGSFRRQLFDALGGFNENLLTNEDYEFNQRLRQAGGVIWLNPEIRSIYYARPTLKSLARQYWRYGYWKGRMLLLYPKSLRWRQALPPGFVLSLLFLLAFAPFWQAARWLLMAQISLYLLVLLAAGLKMAIQKKDFPLMVSFPLAIMCMHLPWGAGLLFSLARAMIMKIIGKETIS